MRRIRFCDMTCFWSIYSKNRNCLLVIFMFLIVDAWCCFSLCDHTFEIRASLANFYDFNISCIFFSTFFRNLPVWILVFQNKARFTELLINEEICLAIWSCTFIAQMLLDFPFLVGFDMFARWLVWNIVNLSRLLIYIVQAGPFTIDGCL